jgi:hypothetical protein
MERYYPPAADQINFTTKDYTAPEWNAVDFAIPYHAPAPDQINFELQPEYQAPAWNNVRFGGGEAIEYSISLRATGPASTTRISLSWGATVPTARLTGEAGRMGWIDAPAKSRTLPGQWQNSEQIDSRTATPWGQAETRDAEPEMSHNQMVQLDQQRQQPWGTFDTADRANQHRHRVPPALDQDQQHPWDSFTSQDRDSGQPYSHPPAKDRGNKQPYWHVDWYADPPLPPKDDDTTDPDAYTPPLWNSVNFVLSNTGYQPPAADQISFGLEVEPEPVAPNKAIHPVQPGTGIPHNLLPTLDQETKHPWGTGSWTRPPPDYGPEFPWPNDPTEEPAERPPQPDIREVYLFMPNITLYRLPDGTEFEATQCVWSTDRDSWGWRFTANLKRDADLAIIKPTSNGPVEIGCEINGHTFTALVESYGRSRQHGNTRYTISGRSRTAWLSDPYAPQRSKALTAAYSAAALAEQELANTGFTLQWNAQDWLIPAGSYSYDQLDPIAAIKRLAEAAGYMLQSHPELKQLIVSPRYRVDPHKWTEPTTALDAILPADLITQDGSTFRTAPAYNRAIVTGGPAGGVIVTVTREGTAGDILAPMATDDLITHSDAGYQRGRSLIAEGGTWEEMNITTMLTQAGQAPGLLLPGHLVEIQDTDDTYPVVIDGTSITATSSDTEIKVRQQLTAERRIW